MSDHATTTISATEPLDAQYGNFDRSEKTVLPDGYVVSEDDVICGRGKHAYNNEGNKRFRKMVEGSLALYASAETKLEKSMIVMNIVDRVRAASPNGGFVKQDSKTGHWVELGDNGAREKCGQTIREMMVQKDPKKRAEKRVKRAIRRAKRKAAAAVSTPNFEKYSFQLSDFEPEPIVTMEVEPISFDLTPLHVDSTTPLLADDDLLRSLQEDIDSLSEMDSKGDSTEATTESEALEFEMLFRMPEFPLVA